MSIKLNARVFAVDADGEPVGGRVTAVDVKAGTVRVSPVFYAPTWVPVKTCINVDDAPAPTPAAPPSAPAAPPAATPAAPETT